MIFTKRLMQGGHTRQFSIERSNEVGWEVREEADSRIVRAVRFGDWHQVERTRAVFEREVTALEQEGWIEA